MKLYCDNCEGSGWVVIDPMMIKLGAPPGDRDGMGECTQCQGKGYALLEGAKINIPTSQIMNTTHGSEGIALTFLNGDSIVLPSHTPQDNYIIVKV